MKNQDKILDPASIAATTVFNGMNMGEFTVVQVSEPYFLNNEEVIEFRKCDSLSPRSWSKCIEKLNIDYLEALIEVLSLSLDFENKSLEDSNTVSNNDFEREAFRVQFPPTNEFIAKVKVTDLNMEVSVHEENIFKKDRKSSYSCCFRLVLPRTREKCPGVWLKSVLESALEKRKESEKKDS